MIKTDRLVLRAPEKDDLAALAPIFSNAQAMAYWSHPAHETVEQTEKTLEGMIKSHEETGLEYVIERNGVVIGKAGLWRMSEIGYILHPDHWGEGLATEALRAILDQAWERHPTTQSIDAEIDPRNHASERLLLGLGFIKSGEARETIQVGSELCDSAYYSLMRPGRA